MACFYKISAIAIVLIIFGSASQLHAQPKRPNIVIILADDLGNGDLACQGARDMRTPHIDLLFKSGMRFNQFYANSSVCSPTRAALLSGRYPELVGVPGVIRTHPNNSWGHLTPDSVLLPEILRRAGYFTAMVGKWHLGLASPNIPTRRGFDFFHGFLGDMMDDYYTHRRHGNNYMRLNEKEIDPIGHATDLFSDWAADFIAKQAKTKQPFFLYLAYNAPHDPIQPPQEWLAKVKKRQPKITDKRAKLIALIEHMDDGIGKVVAALKKAGVYDNTLIIFTSDNGGALRFGANNGPLRDGKGSMYEGGLRVPMCAVWPMHIKRGVSCNVPAITMDIFTTACNAAGANLKHEVEGVSLLPLLLEKAKKLPARDLFYIRKEGGRYKGKNIYAMRHGPWRLVQNMPGAKIEMFNLDSDPMEKKDVSGPQKGLFLTLEKKFRDHIERGKRVPWQPPNGNTGDSKMESAIKKVIATQAAAWNDGDLEAFMTHYWKSDQLTFSAGGKTTRGWAPTLANYKKRYPTREKMGTVSFDELEITPLGDTAALVLGRWRLKRADETFGGRFTLVFRNMDGRWVIVHDHTSRLEGM